MMGPCPNCQTWSDYNKTWDAYFCAKCDIWISRPCQAQTHEECWFDCLHRPEKPSMMQPQYIIAADEVGRGCLAGPLAVGAVLLQSDTAPIPGVADSKALTPQKREATYNALQHVTQVVTLITAEELDKVGVGFALRRVFHTAIRTMLACRENLRWPTVIRVDGKPIDLELSEPNTEIQFVVKGDATDWRIGAASIIAKVTRDRMMVEEAKKYPGYGWERNMGYGTQEHIQAIKERGFTPLHRRSFCRNLQHTEDVLDLLGEG